MATTATNHWKLGLFLVIGVLTMMAALFWLGARRFQRTSFPAVSYFDESVQGLDVGSPVKFRGVTVGRVSGIDIAENLRHVQVTSELSVDQVGKLNLGARGKGRGIVMHPDMRVQLAQAGITGVKFILIDFFDSKTNPVLPLPFRPPPNYIPTAASTMKNLEDSVVKTANRLPEIADDAARAMFEIKSVAEQVQQGRLPERAGETLTQANATLAELSTQLKAMNTAQLSSDAAKNLREFNVILVRTSALLARLDGEQGLFHNAERSAGRSG